MKLLIVEDEHKIANALKQGFEQEHFTVDVAYDGSTGYDFAVSEEYDVIILDRMLPGIDGITFITRLRKEDIHTPILLLTARGQTEEKVQGLDSGADDYMVKPFAFSELLARVRAIARRPKKRADVVYVLDDLTVNMQTYEVKRGQKNISLSGKEFFLLAYLIRHKNQIISKEKIIQYVWNYDADVLPNSVEVYIKHLRQKIETGFKHSLIHTVRGFGYKLSKEEK